MNIADVSEKQKIAEQTVDESKKDADTVEKHFSCQAEPGRKANIIEEFTEQAADNLIDADIVENQFECQAGAGGKELNVFGTAVVEEQFEGPAEPEPSAATK